jgi:hypothetical protein
VNAKRDDTIGISVKYDDPVTAKRHRGTGKRTSESADDGTVVTETGC